MQTKTILQLTIFFFLTACSSNHPIVRVDPKSLLETDIYYGSEELHLFSQKMVTSMMKGSFLNKPKKPYIALGNIKVHSSFNESIDTKLIKNIIRTNLIKSDKVHFIDNIHIKELEKEITYQNNNKFINSHTKKDIGQFIARDYTLTGDIHAIKKENKNFIDNAYILSLRLTAVKTSAVVWAEEKEIRKRITK